MMKKIIFMFSFIFMLMGCSQLQVGQSSTKDNQKITRLTEDNLFYVHDLVTADKNYQANSLSMDTKNNRNLMVELDYYPREKENIIYLDSFGKGKFLRGVLFANGNEKLKVNINNFSSIDSAINQSTYPNTKLSKNDLKKLYSIFKSNNPIIMRVYTNEGVFDINFDNKFRQGLIQVMEVSLGKQKYNI